MKGLGWKKRDIQVVWSGEIGKGLNPDAHLVSVLNLEVGEVGLRDRLDLDDRSVVRGSLKGSVHGRRWEDIGGDTHDH